MIWLSRVMRGLAVAIAVAAAIDPAIPLLRSDRHVVAVIDAGAGDKTNTVSQALSADFDVHAGPIAAASATVIVGDEVPAAPIVLGGSLFTMVTAPASPRIEIERVSATDIAPSGSKVPVTATIRAVGMRGRTAVVELFAGSLAVDAVQHVLTKDDERAEVVLALPPSAAGVLKARVLARDSADRRLAADHHLAVDIRDQRWRLLIVDARPSWASTFVRRALEQDRRFDIASRVGTSKTVGAASGVAPALTDTAALTAFDAIIVGAPDAATAAQARSLERFARERGGAVVLLLDRLDAGPFAPLLGVALEDVHGLERLKVSSAAGNLVATELAVPRGGAITALARATIGGPIGGPIASNATPVIWQSALGAGRLVVNGALDAWRYRAREDGGFAKFWLDAIGAAASASPAPLVLTTGSSIVAPGAAFDVRAVVRDAQLSDAAQPAPAVELAGPLTFWPGAERGVFHAAVKAPDTPGDYQLVVQGSTAQGLKLRQVLNYVVAAPGRRPDPALLAAWTTSRGGVVLGDGVADLVSRVGTAVNARKERIATHPMRSVWWLPAFVILLGGEWWLRRRRGER